MANRRIGAWIITLVALFTIISPYVADWNATHIYNPRWPPHAKFHNAQTMLLAVLLGISALWFIWRPERDKITQRLQLNVAVLFAAAYWITQALSILFPGTAFIDPEFGEIPTIAGLPFQLFVDIIAFVLLGFAYYLERRRLTKQNALHRG
jgi:hypothetical protein